MTELLIVIVAGLVVIAAATVFGPRLGIAAPLVLAHALPAFRGATGDPPPGAASAFLQSLCLFLQTSFQTRADPWERR